MARNEQQDREQEQREWDATQRLLAKLRDLGDEDNFAHGITPLCRYPEFESRRLSEFESDVRDWGFVYGLAFGLAMEDNPDLSHEEAAELAYWPARKRYQRWAGEIEDPVARRENAIRSLVRRFEEIDEERCRTGGRPELPKGLSEALGELADSARA